MASVIEETAKRADGDLLFEAIARWNDEGGAPPTSAEPPMSFRVDEGPHNSDGLLLHGRDGAAVVTAGEVLDMGKLTPQTTRPARA
jgi:hypothetical protein